MNPLAQQSSPGPGTIDPAWRSVLECAAVEVFEMMAGVRPSVNVATSDEPSGEQTAMVGMAGALCGMTTLRCSKAMATHFASLMLGGNEASSPSSARDAIGELCNMIAGNFKAKISTLADRCMLSAPTVITGDDYSMSPLEPSQNITLAMSIDGELIWVSVISHA